MPSAPANRRGANLYATGKQDNPLPNGVRQAAGSINPQLGQADFDNVNCAARRCRHRGRPTFSGRRKAMPKRRGRWRWAKWNAGTARN